MIKDTKIGVETARLLKDRYSQVPRDENEKIMDAIQKLLQGTRQTHISSQTFLSEVGRLIHRLFDFKEIAIGLRSKKDGLYRYEVLTGFIGDAVKARKNLAYTKEEMQVGTGSYPEGVAVSKATEFMLVEMRPYRPEEVGTFNRPTQLAKERTSIEDLLDGDYIDVYFYGRNDEILGWMELSGTRTGKMPSRATIKWLELISSVVASVLVEREASDN